MSARPKQRMLSRLLFHSWKHVSGYFGVPFPQSLVFMNLGRGLLVLLRRRGAVERRFYLYVQ